MKLSAIGFHKLWKRATPGLERFFEMVPPSPGYGQIAQTSHNLHAPWLAGGVAIFIEAPISAIVELIFDRPVTSDILAYLLGVGLGCRKAREVKGAIPSATILEFPTSIDSHHLANEGEMHLLRVDRHRLERAGINPPMSFFHSGPCWGKNPTAAADGDIEPAQWADWHALRSRIRRLGLAPGDALWRFAYARHRR